MLEISLNENEINFKDLEVENLQISLQGSL